MINSPRSGRVNNDTFGITEPQQPDIKQPDKKRENGEPDKHLLPQARPSLPRLLPHPRPSTIL